MSQKDLTVQGECVGVQSIRYLIVGFSHISMVILVSKPAIDAVFGAMFILTDIRVLLRKTAPHHVLDPAQKGEAEALLAGLEKQVEVLRRELLA